jgi:hypothetical protein
MSESTTRQVAKKKPQPKANATAPLRVKTAVSISVEAFERLVSCSTKENMTQGEVIEYLISEMLSAYTVQVRNDGRIKLPADRRSNSSPTYNKDRPKSPEEVSPLVTSAA